MAKEFEVCKNKVYYRKDNPYFLVQVMEIYQKHFVIKPNKPVVSYGITKEDFYKRYAYCDKTWEVLYGRL